MKFEIFEERDGCIRGNFAESNMFAVFKWISDEGEMFPRTEGADFSRNLKIGVRANFYYVMSRYDQCSCEMNRFLSDLNDRSEACFVFSFEMETIYAIKDGGGMRIVEKF
ncbi:hypothetical protein ACQUJZ_22370 [Ralstonia pseudosolanacearum]|uniref:hypothetical protein n=1 Tax=Ralstonia pseudosolanacearum TaxID=1310165 RepID=UPI002676B675|nr:hypothetical protein [Ralstonia pseudosolanacearum]MDO3529676.1 hypothetical protein [Ralstonia pseudosolanacearum]MDO3534619.1 hypothetical protein [Ralstonia pseudosolanacearum]